MYRGNGEGKQLRGSGSDNELRSYEYERKDSMGVWEYGGVGVKVFVLLLLHITHYSQTPYFSQKLVAVTLRYLLYNPVFPCKIIQISILQEGTWQDIQSGPT